MHEVLVNRLGGLSLPRKSVVRLTDRPDMTLDVYRGRKTTMQQQQQMSAENPKYFYYVLVYFPLIKHPKKLYRYLGNREIGNIKVYAPKFPPMTHVKDSPKFECYIYSDIDIHSAISVSSTGNS